MGGHRECHAGSAFGFPYRGGIRVKDLGGVMESTNVQAVIDSFFRTLEEEVARVMQTPEDARISNGNVAVCVLDSEGRVYGKLFGSDKPRQRQAYRVAWTKASQVWLTGVETGEYERRVFIGEIPENANGIDNPDLIGWVGGQPVTLNNGLQFSIGFSGFRGTTDKQIVLDAFGKLGMVS